VGCSHPLLLFLPLCSSSRCFFSPILVLPCNCKLTLALAINFSCLGLLLKFSIHANRLFPALSSAHCAPLEKSKKVGAIPRRHYRASDVLIRKKRTPHSFRSIVLSAFYCIVPLLMSSNASTLRCKSDSLVIRCAVCHMMFISFRYLRVLLKKT